MPKNYHEEYGEFGKKINSRHSLFRKTVDQIKLQEKFKKLSLKTLVLDASSHKNASEQLSSQISEPLIFYK
jgi:hypothetical protein